MQGFLLKVLVLLFLGLAVGLAASHNTSIKKLHLDPPPQIKKAPSPEALRPEPAPTGSTTPQPAGTGTQGTPVDPVAPAATGAPAAAGYFISLADAKKKFDDGSAIFIDARNMTEYKTGHIRGAMQLEKGHFDGLLPAKVRNFLPGSEVIVYCHGKECSDSEAVIKRLQALNLNVGPYHILGDGFPGWQKAGHPVDTGDEVGFQ